jgi:hypothetical protein
MTKNFQSNGKKFRNNELHTVTGIGEGKITVDKGQIIPRGGLGLKRYYLEIRKREPQVNHER